MSEVCISFDMRPSEILIPARIIAVSQAGEGYSLNSRKVMALIDTGASMSAIDHSLVEELQLSTFKLAEISSLGGRYTSSLHMVGIHLDDTIMLAPWVVAAGDVHAKGAGLIIGMDILGRGEFMYSRSEGKHTFTLRLPDAIQYEL